MARKKKLEMEIINPHAAGIDIGSRSHFVAVGQALEDVKELEFTPMTSPLFVIT